MERETAKEAAESFTIYEMGGKFLPVSQTVTDSGTAIYGQLENVGKDILESGSFGLNLDFLRAYRNERSAVDAAKKKWGAKINLTSVKLKQEYSVIKDQNNDPVAVKESFVDKDSLIQEKTQILKNGVLGEQDPAYARETVWARLKTGAYTQQNSSRSEYEELQKAKIIPLPNAVVINLIAERQARYGEKQLIPAAENNLVGKAQIQKDIMESADWIKGKAGDLDAAKRVVDELWPGKKTEQLKEMLGDIKDKVLVTMPSTSGMNVIPKAMALKLAKEFDGKLQAIQGDEFFNLTHNKEVKNIPRFDRAFYKRKYVSEKPFNKNLEGKKAILVDDVFTTGGSVKAFAQELANNKLDVSHIVGLMGDKRFNVDEKTASKLKTALNENSIEVDSEKLSKFLTRTEAGMFIQKINNKGKGLSDDKRREITGRVQGLVKGLFVKNIRGNRNSGRDGRTGGPHHNNAKDVKRVQNRSSRGGQGR